MNLREIDGGPAFPSQPLGQDGKPEYPAEYGMMLRDWFAGQAMAGRMANSFVLENMARTEVPPQLALSSIAEWAYRLSDAMIAARQTAVNVPPSHG